MNQAIMYPRPSRLDLLRRHCASPFAFIRVHSRFLILLALFAPLCGQDLIFAADKKQKKIPFAKAAHKGFAIPQIDLNDRADLQTVISKHDETYMGHPSSVLLDDGKTMIMVYLNKHGRGDLMWRRSADAGKTWSDDLPLPEGWAGTLTIDGKEHAQFLEVPIMYKIDGPDGVQRIVLYTSGRDIHPARYAVSEDGGQTWSKLKPILAGGKTIDLSIVLFSDMTKLKNGRYLFTYHEPGKVFTTTSADGITFDKPKLAATYPEAFLCEGGFVRSPDGKTIALLMRENNRNYNSFISFSKDEGKTWSEPRQMPDSLTGDRHQHTYTPDGRLFISFRDRGAGSPTVGDWVGWVGTFDDLVSGAEGQYRVRLKDNFKGADCAYPSQHILPDGTLFAATYGGWEEGAPNYLLAFHFKIEELDALAAPRAAAPGPFTIPVIDLDPIEKHHVVVDREKDQYLGHPTTVLLEDGKTILTVYPKGHGKGGIVYKRSDDGGRTWSDRLPTPESWATSREVPTLHRVVDAAGVKRLIMWSGLYPARLAVSEDDGATWSELEPVGDWGGIVVMGCLVALDKPGHYMAMFHDDGRFFTSENKRAKPTLFTLYKTFSKDGGLTWSFPEEVYRSTAIHLCEPGAIRSPDGKQIAVLLRENARRRNSHVIFTDDEGKTWSTPRELPASLTGDRHTGQYGPDGRLFISFRDRCPGAWTSPTVGDWVGWVGTYEDIINGAEGQYRVRLRDNTKGADTAYPGVEILPDGTFVTTTYGHWDEGEAPYIRTVRFTLEDLDTYAAAGAAVFERDETHGFRIPSLVTAKNGDLLALCERRVGLHDHAQNDIVLRRSTDNGASWEPLQVIADEGGDSLNDPSAIVLDSGEIVLMYQHFPEGYHTVTRGHMKMAERGFGGPLNTRTVIRRSKDHGKTWSDARDITKSVRRPEAVNIASPGRGIQLQHGKYSGRLLFPVYENHSTAKERIWNTSVLISDDAGKSWRAGAMVPPDDRKGFGNENQVVELKDGSILMSSRNQSGEAKRRLTVSRDGGETWDPYRIADDLVTPQCMASVIRHGGLLVHSLPNSKKGRKDGAILVSRDDGATWDRVHTITPGGFAYSSLTQLADETVACLYEADGYKTIRFARIPDAVFVN